MPEENSSTFAWRRRLGFGDFVRWTRRHADKDSIGGFKMNWHLIGSKKNDSLTKSHWKLKMKSESTSQERDLNLMTIMNIVYESKLNKYRKSEVWKTLLEHRWDLEILKTNPCLNNSQVAEVIYRTGQDLRLRYDWNLWIPEEDLRLGIELHAALHYCPDNLIEAAKLSKLFESHITNENLNTVVAATMHNIQPTRAGDNIKDFTAINMWYQRLDERYNFSLGPNIFPLMTTDNLRQLAALGPPFLPHDKEQAKNKMSTHLGSKGLQNVFDSHLFRREPKPNKPPTSLKVQLELSVHPVLRLQDRSQLLKGLSSSQWDQLSSLLVLCPNSLGRSALL